MRNKDVGWEGTPKLPPPRELGSGGEEVGRIVREKKGLGAAVDEVRPKGETGRRASARGKQKRDCISPENIARGVQWMRHFTRPQ